MIMPSDAGHQQQILAAAKTAASDLGSFCNRNPDVCEQGKAMMVKLGERASEGAEMLVEMTQTQLSKGTNTRADISQSTNTLRADDLIPLWELPKS